MQNCIKMGKKIGLFPKRVLFIAIITERFDTCNTQMFDTFIDTRIDTKTDTSFDTWCYLYPKIRLIILGFSSFENLFS